MLMGVLYVVLMKQGLPVLAFMFMPPSTSLCWNIEYFEIETAVNILKKQYVRENEEESLAKSVIIAH